MKPIIYTITVHDYDTQKKCGGGGGGGGLCPKLWWWDCKNRVLQGNINLT